MGRTRIGKKSPVERAAVSLQGTYAALSTIVAV
jgi:hypothetical protein